MGNANCCEMTKLNCSELKESPPLSYDAKAYPDPKYGAAHNPWQPVVDENSGDIYYWNTSTNATSWDRPPENSWAGGLCLGDPEAASTSPRKLPTPSALSGHKNPKIPSSFHVSSLGLTNTNWVKADDTTNCLTFKSRTFSADNDEMLSVFLVIAFNPETFSILTVEGKLMVAYGFMEVYSVDGYQDSTDIAQRLAVKVLFVHRQTGEGNGSGKKMAMKIDFFFDFDEVKNLFLRVLTPRTIMAKETSLSGGWPQDPTPPYSPQNAGLSPQNKILASWKE